MANIDYEKKYLNQLKEIVLSQIDTEKVMVFLFGSRVSAHHLSRADVDIGLLSHHKLPNHLFHKIRNAVDAVSPKMVIKQLYRTKYINEKDYESLIEMVNDRNRMTHVYNEDQFNAIYGRLQEYLQLMQKTMGKIS